MKKTVPYIAYGAAICAVLFMFLSFVCCGSLEKLVVATGIHPTAWYSGGQEAHTERRKGYTIIVNHPVFRRVYGDAKEGFVQFRLKGSPNLPETIKDTVSVDGYSFGFACTTSPKPSAQITENDGTALRVQWTYRFSDKSIAVRVAVKRKS